MYICLQNAYLSGENANVCSEWRKEKKIVGSLLLPVGLTRLFPLDLTHAAVTAHWPSRAFWGDSLFYSSAVHLDLGQVLTVVGKIDVL